MPIEIRELHIKVVVNQESSTPAARPAAAQPAAPASKDKLVAECVEKVLEILRQKIER